MSAQFTNNLPGAEILEVTVTKDDDDGPFLSLTVSDGESVRDVADLILTSPAEVRAFRDEVNQAADAFLAAVGA